MKMFSKMAKAESQPGHSPIFFLKILANLRLMSLINWSLIKKKVYADCFAWLKMLRKKNDSKNHSAKTINHTIFCLAPCERVKWVFSWLFISCVVSFSPKSLSTFSNALWEKEKTTFLRGSQKVLESLNIDFFPNKEMKRKEFC